MSLDGINPASPAGTDAANTVDDQIRALKQDIKDSFHGNDSGAGSVFTEHYGKGAHKFPVGDGTAPGYAGAPAAGNAGRIFLDSTNGGMLRDDGSIWRFIQGRAKFNSNLTLTFLTTSYQTLTSVVLNAPIGVRILCLATVWLQGVSDANTVTMRVFNGTDALLPGEMATRYGPDVTPVLIVHQAVVTPQNYTLSLQAKVDVTGTPSAVGCSLVAICL